MKRTIGAIFLVFAIIFLFPNVSFAHLEDQELMENHSTQTTEPQSVQTPQQELIENEAGGNVRNEKFEQTELRLFGPYLYKKIEILHRFHDDHPSTFFVGVILVVLIFISVLIALIRHIQQRRKKVTS